MLLVLTSVGDATADYLVPKCSQNGIRVLRLDTNTLLQRVSLAYDGREPTLKVDKDIYRPGDFLDVWYRRPERLLHPTMKDTPEGEFVLDEWSEALEGFFSHIPHSRWMNHPSRNVMASHKIEQLTRAQAFGLRVPDTLVTQEPESLRAFVSKHAGKVIAKPMGSGHIERSGDERDSLIYTNPVLPEHLAELEDLANCPTLFQEHVDKVADVRITVVDRDLHAVELVAKDADGQQRCDIRRDNMDDVKYKPVSPPHSVRKSISALMEHYGLRFAAIDMAVTHADNWVFFEVNPNGQWAWLDLVGVTDIASSFIKAFSRM